MVMDTWTKQPSCFGNFGAFGGCPVPEEKCPHAVACYHAEEIRNDQGGIMDQSMESTRSLLSEVINSQEWRDFITPLVRSETRRQGILPPEGY